MNQLIEMANPNNANDITDPCTKGMDPAWNLGVRRLEVQVDSKCVVKMLSNQTTGTHQYSKLVRHFQRLRARDWEIQIIHIYREANSLADKLAARGHELDPGMHDIPDTNSKLINHGIPEKLMKEVMEVAAEFFELPTEEKSKFCGGDEVDVSRMSCKLSTSLDYENEEVHFWRDVLRLLCHPIETHAQSWPHKPSRYREVVGEYARKVRELSLWVLEMLSEGLGLELGYFGDGLAQVQMMSINNYPPCPNPRLTLGVPKHSDASQLTVLLQGKVNGLQVLLKDGKWVGVQPLPNALVVNIGNVLQVISNGRLKSAVHRVVTNRELARTTVVCFTNPTIDCLIEPAKALTDETHPQLYRASIYKDIRDATVADAHTGKEPLDFFKI